MTGFSKKIAAFTAAVVSVGAVSLCADAFGGVTEVPTPVDKNDAALYWAVQAADISVWESDTAPILVGDELIYADSSSLHAIDKDTGEILDKTGTLAASNYYGSCSLIYADGMIFVGEDSGVVQAFDAETFESLWVYKSDTSYTETGWYQTDDGSWDSYSYTSVVSALSELTYSDGYLYVGYYGSWDSEADFVCLPAADTDTSDDDEAQEAVWTYSSAGGFYWGGAYCTDEYVIVGTADTGSGSSILVFDKEGSIESGEAKLASVGEGLSGSISASIAYDEESGYYYASSKGGYLYRFTVSDEGKVRDLESLDLGGASTSTPVISAGRIYLGVMGSSQYSEYSGHHIAVVDAESFSIAYTVETNGYPQSSALVSSQDGENYVYFTANYTPGTIYVLHDNAEMTEPEAVETATVDGTEHAVCPTLFTPVGEHANYCICSLIADEYGTLYFKNDSGYMFALGSRIESLTVTAADTYTVGDSFDVSSLKVTANLANGLTKDVTEYAEYSIPAALSESDTEIVVSYDGMLYGDTDDEIGHDYGAVYGTLSITVSPETSSSPSNSSLTSSSSETTKESGDSSETGDSSDSSSDSASSSSSSSSSASSSSGDSNPTTGAGAAMGGLAVIAGVIIVMKKK